MRKTHRRFIVFVIATAITLALALSRTVEASFSVNVYRLWQTTSSFKENTYPLQTAQGNSSENSLCSNLSFDILDDNEIENLLGSADRLYQLPLGDNSTPILDNEKAFLEDIKPLIEDSKWSELIEEWNNGGRSWIHRLSETNRIFLATGLIQANLEVSEDFSKPLPIKWIDIYNLFPNTSFVSRDDNSWSIGYKGYLFENVYLYLEKVLTSKSFSEVYLQELRNSRDKVLDTAMTFSRNALCLSEGVENRAERDGIYKWQWQIARILKYRGDVIESERMYDSALQTVDLLEERLSSSENSTARFDFRDRVENLYREYISLVTDSGSMIEDANANKKAKRTLDSLQLTDLENLLNCTIDARNFSDLDGLTGTRNATAAIIYPIILKDRLEVLWKLPSQKEFSRFTVSVSSSDLKENIGDLQEELEKPYFSSNSGKPLASKFYEWLIRGFETDAAKFKELEAVDTLVFVLDKELRNIPMAALYDEAEGKFLIEKYAIAISINGLEFPIAEPRRGFRALLAGLYDQPELDLAQIEFGKLSNVITEITEIAKILPDSTQILNENFTREALQQLISSSPYNVVHLATHGQFSYNEEDTFILMAAKSDDFLGEDNIQADVVRADKVTISGFKEIFSQSLEPIQLLVFSACETATGDDRAILGLAGMAVESGAQSALATLWSVSDLSSAEFMSKLYTHLKDSQLTKAQVLQKVQIDLLKAPETYRPSHWAPYVLVGDWR